MFNFLLANLVSKLSKLRLLTTILLFFYMNMANSQEDAEDVRDYLLNGVSSVATNGSAGTAVVLDSSACWVLNTYAVYSSRTNIFCFQSTNPLLAASLESDEKIVITGQVSLLDFNVEAAKEDNAVLYRNIVSWLSGSADKGVAIVTYSQSVADWLVSDGYSDVTVVDESGLVNALTNAAVFIGRLGKYQSSENVVALQNFISAGKGVFLAETYSSLVNVSGFAANEVLEGSGLGFADGVVYKSDKSSTASVSSRRSSYDYIGDSAVLAIVDGNRGDYDKFEVSMATGVTKAWWAGLCDSSTLALLNSAYETKIAKLTPTTSVPIRDGMNVSLLDRENRLLDVVPVDEVTAHRMTFKDSLWQIPEDAELVTKKVIVNSRRSGWHPTGLYAKPGEVVTITVPRELVMRGWQVQVGHLRSNHYDFDRLNRMPDMQRMFNIYDTTVKVANCFGGLIHIIAGDLDKPASFEIEIANAIEAPAFILGETTADEWLNQQRDNPAPWSEVYTDNWTAIGPSYVVRNLDDMVGIMTFWSEVVQLQDELCGLPQRTKIQAHVTDPLLQYGVAGWSGNPYQGLLSWYNGVNTDVDNPKVNWGHYHEIGHNHQRGDWTFSGDGEITCNIMAFINTVTTIIDPSLHNQATPLKAVLSAKKSVEQGHTTYSGNTDHWSLYYNLICEFKPSTFRKAFIDYRANGLVEFTNTNEAEHDSWLVRFSQAAGYDLTILFRDYWKLTIGQEAIDMVSALPDWLPLVPTAPEKVNIFSCLQDTATSFNVSDTVVTFAENSVSAVSQGTNGGSVISNGDGTVTFTPATGFVGVDSFTYEITNSVGNSMTQTATVRVVLSESETVSEVAVSTMEGAAVDVDLASLVDASSLELSGVAAFGFVVANGTTVTYTPNEDFFSQDFRYGMSDGWFLCKVTKSDSSIDWVKVVVTVNHAKPQATSPKLTLEEDSELTFQPLDYVTDADGDELKTIYFSNPLHGTAVLNDDGTVTYTPDENYVGPDCFCSFVRDELFPDGKYGVVAVYTDITVTPVNEAPVATDDVLGSDFDNEESLTFTIDKLLENDFDNDGDIVSFTEIVTTTVNGNLVDNGGGSYTYTPTGEFSGDSFTYKISDGTSFVDEATVTIRDISSGLLGWWRFDDGAGTRAYDFSDSKRHGTLVDESAWSSEGAFGGSVALDGESDSVDVGNIGSILAGSATVSAWIKTTQTGGELNGSTVAICGVEQSWYNRDIKWGVIDDTGRIGLYGNASYGIGVRTVLSTTVINDGNWHHVVCTRDISECVIKVYIDGELENSAITDDITLPTAYCKYSTFGYVDGSGGAWWNGSLDCIRIYDRAISLDEVKKLYNYSPRYEPPVAENDSLVTVANLSKELDVLANDFDESIPLLRIDSISSLPFSGSVDIIGDRVIKYTPNAEFVGEDSFSYKVVDIDGQTAIGFVNVTVMKDPSGMCGWWRLDESSGLIAVDCSGNGLTGTLEGSPSWLAEGKFAGAIDLDGVDDAIDVGELSSVLGSTSSMSAWIKTTQAGSDTRYTPPVICGIELAWTKRDIKWGAINSNGQIGLVGNVYSGKGVGSVLSTTAVNDGTWHHVAMTRDCGDGTIKVYVDGKLENSANDGDSTTITASFSKLGYLQNLQTDTGDAWWDGSLDDIRIYDYVLSGNEVEALYCYVPKEEAPLAKDDTLVTTVDVAKEVDLLVNDIDEQAHLLSISSILSEPLNGTVTITGQSTVKYTPNGGYIGGDVFSYQIEDSNGNFSSALVSVVVEEGYATTPLAHWRLDEVERGAVVDSSGNSFNGTISGATIGEAGHLGSAYYFDSVNDHLVLPSLNITTNTMTIAGWVNLTEDQDDWGALFSAYNGSASTALNVGSDRQLKYHWNGGKWSWRSGLFVPANRWVFIALVIQADRATVYMYDGVNNGSASNVSSHDAIAFDGENNSRIGIHCDINHRRLKGKIDDVRIYSSVLSETDLYNIYRGTTGANAPPIANDDFYNVDENSSITISVLANDSDPDGDLINIESYNQTKYGTVTKSGDSFVYTPETNWFGVDTFTYSVADESGVIASALVTIVVSPVNTAPAFLSPSFSRPNARIAKPYSGISMYGSAIDYDGDSLSYHKVSGPEWLSISADGTLSGTPTNEDVGINEFVISVTDGYTTTRGSIEATIFINVAPTLTPAIGLQLQQLGEALSWTVESEIGIKEYRIYDLETGKLLKTVEAGKKEYIELVPEDADIHLVVIDKNGFAQTFVPTSDDRVKVFYDLEEGWNLIAMPGKNADITELMTVTLGDLWEWDNNSYKAVESPAVGKAVWCYAPEKVQVVIPAEPVEMELPLHTGWNMVGPTENTIIPANAHTVYTWVDCYMEVAEEEGILLQGVGYWIFCL